MKDRETPHTPTSADALLEQMSLLEERASEGRPISDAQLQAYRSGELDEAESASVEKQLANDVSSRERLAELAGEPLPSPSPFLRSRVLKAYRGGEQKQRRWQPWAIAALLIASLSGLLLNSQAPSLPKDLSYEISAVGLAQIRSEGVATEVIEARADTLIEVTVTPALEAEGDVDFALYLAGPTDGRRLDGGDEPRINRGVGILGGRAGDLVGKQPGDYELWVVIARPGDLPEALSLEELRSTGDRRRAYRQRLTLLP